MSVLKLGIPKGSLAGIHRGTLRPRRLANLGEFAKLFPRD